jgi:anti-sigma regulatory factor (Ser/Thr protein kinase)
MRTIEASPRAALLIESMRDIGYTLETALADVVDNSITAGCSEVRLFADSEHLRIGIMDDGEGMTHDELMEAMRPGSRSPLERRKSADLGRFGLGLKTASFSQCRRLSVVTRKQGVTSAAQWDLDHVASTDRWLVRIPDDPLTIPSAEFLGEQGTLVVWENLDRFLSDDPVGNTRNFVRRVAEARDHLELVFHRFLQGEKGLRRIAISLNGSALEPFDPFHSSHLATQRDPPQTIRYGGREVVVQAFTLPHHRKVTPREWERYGGTLGYLKNQGFYVYREKRLIIHGTWFGLARQTELTKLSRVRIDISNEQDADWKVDVRKASVQPPFAVKEHLRGIIETIGATSKRVFTSRGKRLTDDNRLPVWTRVQTGGEIQYRINTEHPVIADLMEQLSDTQRSAMIRVLQLASGSLPLDALFADLGGSPDRISGDSISDETLLHATRLVWERLSGAGVGPDEIRGSLQTAEPFRSNWERTELILDSFLPQALHD